MEIKNNVMRIKGYKDSFSEIQLNCNMYMMKYFRELPEGKHKIEDSKVINEINYVVAGQRFLPTTNEVMVNKNEKNNAVTFFIRGECFYNGNPEDLDTFLTEIGGRKL